jgi:alpha-amylase/alpha-mannosidase (GH57 family)
MHQPYYKDPETGTYILPWVRLHAIKDYVALPRIFREFPAVRHTFNLVPSLLIQLRDYVENGAEDMFLALSRKNSLDLTRDEEEFLLRNFFSAFPPTMILPQPRYADLYARREAARAAIGKPGAPGGFGSSEYTDLMTLFNLTWFHPMLREEDGELSRLWRKGRGYTEREKAYVLDRQVDVMGAAIPEYRKLQEDGGELSSTPMYHPILPLLVDTKAAQDALPGAPLPETPFAYPEDALEQLARGRQTFRSLFGSYPDGMWPSEGSISPATMDLAAGASFRWAATDEALLSKAFAGKPVLRNADGVPSEPDWLYRPYRANTPSGSLDLFFRDHHLSDLIGFEYSRWGSSEAVNNFIHKISMIGDKLSSLPSGKRKKSYVIPVILDGENAWEYFYDSGRLFLRGLMDRLGKLGPNISCTTFSQALQHIDYVEDLAVVPTGSWIDGTFNIWIGHEEDRKAWSMLSKARALWQIRRDHAAGPAGAIPPELERAREHLFVAEGSDWCWWYGDDHFTPHAAEFDRLFRNHLKAAYREMGEDSPDSLDIPIIRTDRMPAINNVLASPRIYIRPRINGSVTSYFEWSAATRYIPNPGFGTMHRAGHGILSCLYYGFDESRIFLRADFVDLVFQSSPSIEAEFLFPSKNLKLSLSIGVPDRTLGFTTGPIGDSAQEDESVAAPEAIQAAFHKVLEIGIPFRELGCEHDERIDFFLTLAAEGMIGERWPMYGTFTAELPGKHFEERMWEV